MPQGCRFAARFFRHALRSGKIGSALNRKVPARCLLSRLPEAAQDCGEGAVRSDPGGVDRQRQHPPPRRTGAGDGHDRDLQVLDVEAVQGHRRARPCLAQAPACWRLALIPRWVPPTPRCASVRTQLNHERGVISGGSKAGSQCVGDQVRWRRGIRGKALGSGFDEQVLGEQRGLGCLSAVHRRSRAR